MRCRKVIEQIISLQKKFMGAKITIMVFSQGCKSTQQNLPEKETDHDLVIMLISIDNMEI